MFRPSARFGGELYRKGFGEMRKLIAAFFVAATAFMSFGVGTASATCLWTEDGVYLCDDAG